MGASVCKYSRRQALEDARIKHVNTYLRNIVQHNKLFWKEKDKVSLKNRQDKLIRNISKSYQSYTHAETQYDHDALIIHKSHRRVDFEMLNRGCAHRACEIAFAIELGQVSLASQMRDFKLKAIIPSHVHAQHVKDTLWKEYEEVVHKASLHRQKFDKKYKKKYGSRPKCPSYLACISL